MFAYVATDECYTPENIIAAAYAAMDGVDTDPCWSDHDGVWLKPETRYTREDQLTPDQQEWNGKVWLNPPFSKAAGGVGPWLDKAMWHDVMGKGPVIALVKHDSRPEWWKWTRFARALVTVDGYPEFTRPGHEKKNRINFPVSLIVFDRVGRVDLEPLRELGRVWS